MSNAAETPISRRHEPEPSPRRPSDRETEPMNLFTNDPIRYDALGLDRATALRRVRAWKKFANELPWGDDDPRRPILERAHASLLANREAIPDDEIEDVLVFAVETPSDDDISIAITFGEGDRYPEPALRGFEERASESLRLHRRLSEIRGEMEDVR